MKKSVFLMLLLGLVYNAYASDVSVDISEWTSPAEVQSKLVEASYVCNKSEHVTADGDATGKFEYICGNSSVLQKIDIKVDEGYARLILKRVPVDFDAKNLLIAEGEPDGPILRPASKEAPKTKKFKAWIKYFYIDNE